MKSSIFTWTASALFSLAAAAPGNGHNNNNNHNSPLYKFQQKCNRLAQSFRPDANTQVLIAQYLPTGANVTNPDSHPTCQGRPSTTLLADMCRLRLKIKTSATSEVVMEAWMPLDWKKGRYLMLGNGGLGGCIAYSDMAFTTWMGFATIGHNNGHFGLTGEPFLNNPAVVEDFSYRALKTVTKTGKKAVRHLYSTSVKKSYYLGCSAGGRQGLKAAQDFPEEYDGIVVGAPAIDWNALVASQAHYYKISGDPNAAGYLTGAQWSAMRNEILAQCDGLDGVVDGVIEEPRGCNPRFEELMCAAGQTWASHSCLTAAQVSTVRKFFEPMYGRDGNLVFPRFDPGVQPNSDYYDGEPPSIADEWYKYAVFNDPNWDLGAQYSLDMVQTTMNQDLYNISTWKDLTKLKQSGHKLLAYHGLEDPVINSENTYRYYENVSRSMSLTSAELDPFFRYFPIPGASHCWGGSGNWYVGATSQISRVFGATTIPTEGGVLMSMVKWVEQGVAPERIVGRKLDIPTGAQASIKLHCKWPKKNVYLGGNANAQESWGCQ
ncbi:Tannase and feruloyl esterase [Arthrobotrys musiformis]|uniref:Carboxylic ester hydrolase n=1 Tax=Arthrobotrys musiformis TaxID=47236 RepID=A0AAV9VZ15_9PEZI